jgi:hypothetical protein
VELMGESLEKFQDALCDAFDSDTLEQMVLIRLGKVLYGIVAKGPLETVAFKLIERARQEGWTEALIRGAYVTRPNNPKIQAFCKAYFPQAEVSLDPATQVRVVRDGLNALCQIIAQMGDPSVRGTVGRFRADFETTREKIGTLAKYKALHDHLHVVQIQFLGQIVDAAALFRQSAAQFKSLVRYAVQIHGCAARARKGALGLPSYPREASWTDDLDRAGKQIEEALNGTDDAPLQKAIVTLRGVLAEAPRINSLLTVTAEDLRLEQLTRAMREIRNTLDRSPAGGDGSLPVREFREGLEGLQALEPRLAGLVQEHYEWQWLDKEFAVADSQQADTAEDRFPRWADLRTRLARLCDLSPEKDWAKELSALAIELEAAGAAPDRLQFDNKYIKFRTVASDRFFNVDAELLELSAQLSDMVTPLDHLLRVVTNDPN